MRRFLIALGICALLFFSCRFYAAVKIECCPTHFQILKAYQESMQSLVDKVKAENVAEFEARYHNKEAMTYLELVKSALEDVVAHYKELNDAEDGTATQTVLDRVDKYIKLLTSAKGAEAKKVVESIDVSL